MIRCLPHDPVFASRNGTPVNENNMAKRILKPIGTALDMPWLSWHVFRHTHSTLTKTLEMHVNDRMALMGHASAEMTDRYTHEDRERMRAGVETISNRIWKPEKAINVIDIASIRSQKKKNSATSGNGNRFDFQRKSGSTTEALLAEQKGRRFESSRAYQPSNRINNLKAGLQHNNVPEPLLRAAFCTILATNWQPRRNVAKCSARLPSGVGHRMGVRSPAPRALVPL
jgi:Phage integrase family